MTEHFQHQGSAIEYRGSLLEYLKLSYSNALLVVLTFGLYLPWAKTNRRNFLFKNTFMHKQLFQYTGKGEDLFWKWLLAIAVFAIFGALMGFLAQWGSGKAIFLVVHNIVLILSFIIFAGWMKLAGIKYFINQSKLSSQNFSSDLNLANAVREYTLGCSLSILTLGLYYPVFYLKIQNLLLESFQFKNQKYQFQGRKLTYFWICLRGFFLNVLTLGFYQPWHLQNRWKFLITNLQSNEHRWTLNIDSKKLLYYALVRWLLMTFSFGILSPVVTHKWMQLFLKSLHCTALAPTDQNHSSKAQTANPIPHS